MHLREPDFKDVNYTEMTQYGVEHRICVMAVERRRVFDKT
jgi:hypothetical protein